MDGHQEVVERGVLVFVMERSANFPKQVGWSLDLELGAVGQSCRLGVIYNFLGFLCPRGCLTRNDKRTTRKEGMQSQVRVLRNGPTCPVFPQLSPTPPTDRFHLPKHPVPCIVAVKTP